MPHQLYDTEPTGPAWSSCDGMKNLLDDDADGDGVHIGIRVEHLLAWVAHHRPDDLPAALAALGG